MSCNLSRHLSPVMNVQRWSLEEPQR